MDRRNQLGMALIGLAILLFVIPAVFPVQPMLSHDTRRTIPENPEQIRDDGFEIIAYENLSERGQTLYVQTLKNDGEYRVPQGQGATEFTYPTSEERRASFQNESNGRLGSIVIKRPADDTGLPPADERIFRPREEDERNRSGSQAQAIRYDAMRTALEYPPLDSPPQLSRLLSALLAVLAMGLGGYLLSSN